MLNTLKLLVFLLINRILSWHSYGHMLTAAVAEQILKEKDQEVL